ncbi:pilin protein [Anaerovibrio sp.]|uniref:pilin protein n=1 Tax=Anaerovibrio sp. TaxID=1872532 RepID=UPI0026234A91|nr:pilin protein [Anaerovibrio sp.]MDD6598638.1 pilin protein [Anaerovibrio sp.]
MFTILTHLKNRYLSQKAQGIVEYALILAFVVVLAVVLTSDTGLQGAIEGVFGNAASKVNEGTNAGK